MNITDPYSKKWAENSVSGRQCTKEIHEIIEARGINLVRENTNNVVENIYCRLPSGDYGRGDVRRVVLAIIEEHEEPKP